jgi:hypothetical protein
VAGAAEGGTEEAMARPPPSIPAGRGGADGGSLDCTGRRHRN